MTAWETSLLIIVGAVIFLDHWPAIQTMISRPIVVGPVAGMILGHPMEGAVWGAVFEVAYLGVLPIGASRYPDAGLAALVGTSVAVSGQVGSTTPAGFAVACGVLAGFVGERVSWLVRIWNGRVAAWTHRRVVAGDERAPGRALGASLAVASVAGAIQSALMLSVGFIGLASIGQTAWAGPLPLTWVRLSALCGAVVVGNQLFSVLRARRGMAVMGAIAGALVASWMVSP